MKNELAWRLYIGEILCAICITTLYPGQFYCKAIANIIHVPKEFEHA